MIGRAKIVVQRPRDLTRADLQELRRALDLKGYAPELNPDELVWNYMKRTGTARSPVAKGESLHQRIDEELFQIKWNPALVRSFFKAKDVSYISD
jgi:transposase